MPPRSHSAANDARASRAIALGIAALMCALLAPAAVVTAQPRLGACGRSGSPWVAVAFRGEALARADQDAVLLDLRAGLRLAGIDACPLGTEGSEPPLAVLELAGSDPTRVLVGIEVHDALTHKRVQRDLDMSDLSADARTVAIAAAAEELLRASWVELALADAPAPSRPAPPEVTRSVSASLEPARVGRRDHGVSARFAFEHYTAGLSQLGADAYALLWIGERLGIDAGAGVRSGFSHSSAHGSIESQALVAHADLAWSPLTRSEVVGAALKLGAQLSSVHLRGVADDRSQGARGAGIAVHARASLATSLAPWPFLAITLEMGAGLPLRAIEAADAGHVAVSNAGVELRGAAGLEARF